MPAKKQLTLEEFKALNQPSKRQLRYQRARRLLSFLYSEYPKCFNYSKRLPLKVGIAQDIGERHPEEVRNKGVLGCALRLYTHSNSYWNAILYNDDRVDLLGKPAGKVLEKHRVHAKEQIKAASAARDAKNAKKEALALDTELNTSTEE